MQCEICGGLMEPGLVLYRVNPRGETPARWRCTPCMDADPEGELKRLATVLVDVPVTAPIRVAHHIQPDEPDHACRGCGEELELRDEMIWREPYEPLVCIQCGAVHTWSAEGGYGDDGSGWRWWVTGVVRGEERSDG